MSAKERKRLKIFERVSRGELTRKDAALCGLDYRYVRRLYKRYCALGDRGLVHQGRGRQSNRAYASEFKVAVLKRYQERYSDFGPTLAVLDAARFVSKVVLEINELTLLLRTFLISHPIASRVAEQFSACISFSFDANSTHSVSLSWNKRSRLLAFTSSSTRCKVAPSLHTAQ